LRLALGRHWCRQMSGRAATGGFNTAQ